MNPSDPQNPGLKKLGTIKRKVVSLSQADLMTIDSLQPGQALPVLI